MRRNIEISGNSEQRDGVALDSEHGDGVGTSAADIPSQNRTGILDVGIDALATVGADDEVIRAARTALEHVGQLDPFDPTPRRPGGNSDDAQGQTDGQGKPKENPGPAAAARRLDRSVDVRLRGLR